MSTSHRSRPRHGLHLTTDLMPMTLPASLVSPASARPAAVPAAPQADELIQREGQPALRKRRLATDPLNFSKASSLKGARRISAKWKIQRALAASSLVQLEWTPPAQADAPDMDTVEQSLQLAPDAAPAGSTAEPPHQPRRRDNELLELWT